MERNAVKQKGLSPKLVADLIVSVAAFAALALFGFDVNSDPVIAGFIAKGAGFIAGVIVGPGRVVLERVGEPSDQVLEDTVSKRHQMEF